MSAVLFCFGSPLLFCSFHSFFRIRRWSDILEAQQSEEEVVVAGGGDPAPRRRFFTDEVVHDAVCAAGGQRIE